MRTYNMELAHPLAKRLMSTAHFKNFLEDRRWDEGKQQVVTVTRKPTKTYLNKWLSEFITLNRLAHTCSMAELGNLDDCGHMEEVGVGLFFDLVRYCALAKSYSWQQVIINSNEAILETVPELKLVYEYEGNNDWVWTYMYDLRRDRAGYEDDE